MSSISKYSQYGKNLTRLPKEKKFKLSPGAGDDDGKWYRCWNCGFTNNTQRTAVGSGSGIALTLENGPNVPRHGVATDSVGLSGSIVLQKNGFFEKHQVSPIAGSGCPLCGSLNTR